MAVIHNITVEAGATFQLLLEWKDDADQPVDITGYDARMHVRRDVDDVEAAIELGVGYGLTVSGSDGSVLIDIAPSQTSELSGSYVYDLEIESEAGVVTRLVQGSLTASKEITRE